MRDHTLKRVITTLTIIATFLALNAVTLAAAAMYAANRTLEEQGELQIPDLYDAEDWAT